MQGKALVLYNTTLQITGLYHMMGWGGGSHRFIAEQLLRGGVNKELGK